MVCFLIIIIIFHFHTNPLPELPDEGNGILALKFIDTPGFGDNMDNMDSFNEIAHYIDSQFDEVLAEESRVKRNPRFADNRVHALVYFINPTSHGLREPDVEFMKMMAPRVNVIPVIAKSDSLTLEELELNKRLIMEDIRQHRISIYGFPGGDGFLYDGQPRTTSDSDAETSSIVDEEFNELNDFIRTKLPFAVIGASEIIDAGNGTTIQARRYPWGVLDVNNPECSDVELLRDVITRTHLQDLKETTHFVLYENYRTKKLSTGLSSSVPATPIPDSADSTKVNQYPFPAPFALGANSSVVSMNSRDGTVNSQEAGPYFAGSQAKLAGPSQLQHQLSQHSNGSQSAFSDGVENSAFLAREEQLRASEVKLRMVENQVQQEILQKRQELLARERELKELEAKLKSEAEMLKSNVGSPGPNAGHNGVMA